MHQVANSGRLATMNAPVVEISSCNTFGMGRFNLEDATTKVNATFTTPRENGRGKPFNDAKLGAIKSVDFSKCDPQFKKDIPIFADETKSCGSSTVEKRIRFALDKKGRVRCQTYKNKEIRTKKESFECWYTPEEFKVLRNSCKQEAIKQQKTTYRESFASVYTACTKGNFKGVTKERAYISAASCRGLEVVVFPTLHADRKNAIATVLKTQAALPNSVSGLVREEAIASASRYLSKQARQLARVFGSGDAAVVVANNRIAALQNERGCVPHCFVSC